MANRYDGKEGGEVSEWLPIENVPNEIKDSEQRILAYREGYGENIAVVWWRRSICNWQAVHGGAEFHDVTMYQELEWPE